MLLSTLGVSLLGNLLTGKGVKRPHFYYIPGQRIMRTGEGTIRAAEGTVTSEGTIRAAEGTTTPG